MTNVILTMSEELIGLCGFSCSNIFCELKFPSECFNNLYVPWCPSSLHTKGVQIGLTPSSMKSSKVTTKNKQTKSKHRSRAVTL